jgi:hypothetical protein
MRHDELYEAWKRHRQGGARAELPADFADRVLGAIRAHELRPLRRLACWLLALAMSRLGRALICTLAFLLFAVRVASTLAIFLTGLPEIGE